MSFPIPRPRWSSMMPGPGTATGDAPARDAPLSRTDRVQRHALDSMNHRPRRWASVSIVIVAVVLFGVLAYVGSRRSPPSNHAHSARATSSTAARRIPLRQRHPTKGKDEEHHHHGAHPGRRPVVDVEHGGLSGELGGLRLTVTTTGPCWVSATTATTGSTLWAGTLQAGATQEIQASGIVRVQLGTTAASLALDGVPVVLPTPLRSPFEATFEPSTTSSSPGGAASTTATTGATGTTTTTSAP